MKFKTFFSLSVTDRSNRPVMRTSGSFEYRTRPRDDAGAELARLLANRAATAGRGSGQRAMAATLPAASPTRAFAAAITKRDLGLPMASTAACAAPEAAATSVASTAICCCTA